MRDGQISGQIDGVETERDGQADKISGAEVALCGTAT